MSHHKILNRLNRMGSNKNKSILMFLKNLAINYIILFHTNPLIANNLSTEDNNFSSFYLGNCHLKTDPQILRSISAPYFHLCTKLKTLQNLAYTDKKNTFSSHHLSELYLGLHGFHKFALHWQGNLKEISSDLESNTHKFSKFTKLAALEIGKPSLHKLRFIIGKIPAAFGVNKAIESAYHLDLNPDYFWDSPKYSTRITIDNLFDFMAEFSLSSENFSHKELSKLSRSIRIGLDSSAWFASRLLLSVYSKPNEDFRYGAAIVNRASNDTLSHIEWVRIISIKNPEKYFEQIIRLAMSSPLKNNRRQFFQYDDILNIKRQGSFGEKIYMKKKFHWSYAIAYTKDETPKKENLWSLIFGIGAKL